MAESGGAWIDIFIPVGVEAGVVSGNVVVDFVDYAGVARQLELPLSMTVLNFSLPATSPFSSHFGYDTLPDDDDPEGTAQRYLELGLMHRISMSDAFGASPDLNTPYVINFTAFKAKWGQYISGWNAPFGLQNTRVTAVRLNVPLCSNFSGGNPACIGPQVAYWRQVAADFQAECWEGLLFDYGPDEPTFPADFVEIAARSTALHAANPRLRELITTDMPTVRLVHEVVQLLAANLGAAPLVRGATHVFYVGFRLVQPSERAHSVSLGRPWQWIIAFTNSNRY